MKPSRIHFRSGLKPLPGLPHPDQGTIRASAEHMLFGADLEFAYARGGELARRFIDALPPEWVQSELVIDSRTHMLMPGWYPCIPGWHLDDVPREREDGQPNHQDPSYQSEHILMVAGEDAFPRFALGEITLTDVPEGAGVVYGKWHPRIERAVRRGQLRTLVPKSGELIRFNWQTFHRGEKATCNSWRYFIRATRNTGRKPRNEQRRQVQVYPENLYSGW